MIAQIASCGRRGYERVTPKVVSFGTLNILVAVPASVPSDSGFGFRTFFGDSLHLKKLHSCCGEVHALQRMIPLLLGSRSCLRLVYFVDPQGYCREYVSCRLD